VPGEFGDIIWKRKDPKTWELSNPSPTGRQEAAPTSSVDQQIFAEGQDRELAKNFGYATDQDQELPAYFAAGGSRRELTPAERRIGRKSVRGFLKALKTADPYEWDPRDAIEELMAGGYTWYDEDGFGSNFSMNLSKKDNELMVKAFDAWGDQVGLWKDGQFDPEAPKRYWEYQRKLFEAQQELERMKGEMGP
jgi:hypothetical protein